MMPIYITTIHKNKNNIAFYVAKTVGAIRHQHATMTMLAWVVTPDRNDFLLCSTCYSYNLLINYSVNMRRRQDKEITSMFYHKCSREKNILVIKKQVHNITIVVTNYINSQQHCNSPYNTMSISKNTYTDLT